MTYRNDHLARISDLAQEVELRERENTRLQAALAKKGFLSRRCSRRSAFSSAANS